MTRTQDIEAVRAACVKANEDIMKLEFGCQLRSADKRHKRYYVGHDTENDEHFYAELDQVGSEDSMWSSDGVLSKKQSLGRDIQLADIVLALRKKIVPGAEGHPSLISRAKEMEILKIWDMRKTLEGQSDETLRALAALLGNE